MSTELFICVGVIIAPHGIKGNVKVKSYTSVASNIATYKKLYDQNFSTCYTIIHHTTPSNNQITLSLSGITTRNQAEELVGQKLYISRDVLPVLACEEEFYHVDLVGMKVLTTSGERVGEIKAIHNFGAGDIVEIFLNTGQAEYFSFTKEIFPEVKIKEGVVIIADLGDDNSEPDEQ